MPMSDTVAVQPHYLYVIRLLIDLFNAGELPGVATVDVEPVYGYVARITGHDGSVFMLRGTHLDVNPDGASEIARDKGYTKFFLRRLGYHTSDWKVFVLPRFQQIITRNLARYGFTDYPEMRHIAAFIQQTAGYPCFIKPNDESQGRGVYKCYDFADVEAALAEYQRENYNTIIVEQMVPYPDYRVVVYAGELIACYLRRPLTIQGDGQHTVRQLIEARQLDLNQRQRPAVLNPDDPRLAKKLTHHDLTLESVLAAGVTFQLHDVSNLSSGGEAEDFTDRMHPSWRALCIALTAQMGLRLCGLDFACPDITSPDAPYSIIELNAAPGLDNYATIDADQAQRVRELYRHIFNQSTGKFPASESGQKPPESA